MNKTTQFICVLTVFICSVHAQAQEASSETTSVVEGGLTFEATSEPFGASLIAAEPVDTSADEPKVLASEGFETKPFEPEVVGEVVRQRFPNGKVNVERWVVESATGDLVNHGTYVRYNDKGQVIVSGKYNMGTRDGDWSKQLSSDEAKQASNSTLIGFKPPFISKATFNRGKLEGDWTCSDAAGKLVFVWAFKNDKRNGPSTMFNAKDEMIRTINYVDNLANGPAKVALKKDQPAEEIRFENGRMLRRVDQHFPETAKGKKKVLKSQDWYLVPTPYNVASSSWETNKVEYRSYDKEDMIRHGRAITFFSNGQRESEGQYSQGKKTGTFVWWYSNGQQKTVGEYQKDKEEGKWSWWHQNGMREASGMFSAGTKVEQWSVWNAEGKLVKRARPGANARTAAKPLPTSK